MTTNMQSTAARSRVGLFSVLSASAAAALAAVTHSYDFGAPAFLAGGIVIALLFALGLGYQQRRRRALLVPYVLINLWIIFGFGVVGGFWDHVVKGILCALNGGFVPAALEPWFTSPDLGGPAYEIAWVLTFLAAIPAAVFGYRFVRMTTTGRSRHA